jgi:hypothetical protein
VFTQSPNLSLRDTGIRRAKYFIHSSCVISGATRHNLVGHRPHGPLIHVDYLFLHVPSTEFYYTEVTAYFQLTECMQYIFQCILLPHGTYKLRYILLFLRKLKQSSGNNRHSTLLCTSHKQQQFPLRTAPQLLYKYFLTNLCLLTSDDRHSILFENSNVQLKHRC